MDRREIIDSVRSLFEARGFEGATLAEIARASGLSKASLYHHFPDGKAGIGLAVLKDAGIRLERTVLSPLRGPETPEAGLTAMVEGLEAYFEGGARPCLLTVFAYGPPDAHFDALIAQRLTEWIDLLASTLQSQGIGKKEARRSARELVARVQGAAMLARALGDTKPFRQVLKRAASDLRRAPLIAD